jgi:hypothetical protein
MRIQPTNSGVCILFEITSMNTCSVRVLSPFDYYQMAPVPNIFLDLLDLTQCDFVCWEVSNTTV